MAVLGRQVSGAPVEGFPDGLPEFTPKGVRITLENMIGLEIFSEHTQIFLCPPAGPDGEMVMNPIPGEAGTDYPVLSSVPDTGFSCAQQSFPGIYTDTGADCQVGHRVTSRDLSHVTRDNNNDVVRCSTCANLTAAAQASSAPTGRSSTSSTSCVTGESRKIDLMSLLVSIG